MDNGMEGIVVLDLSSLLPGPYCTSLLLSMGAEIWKIERPGSGDPSRTMPESFANLNWGKKSVTLNFSRPEGKDLFYKMAEKADVIVESFRPGVVKRLGIDYKAIQEINPDIIYCSISGYGQEGPYRYGAAHDINIQALCGTLSPFTEQGANPEPILPLGDLSAGVFSTIGILNALLKRQKNGEGSYIDISMADGPLTWKAISQLVGFRTEHGYEVLDRLTPQYGSFETRDGKVLALGIVYEDHLWKNFCKAVEQPQWEELTHIDRIQEGIELRDNLRRLFLSKNRDEWLQLLKEYDIPLTPLNSFEEAIKEPQFAQRGVIQLKELNGTTIPLTKNPILPVDKGINDDGAPQLGAHTVELLTKLGLDRDEISHLQRNGTI